MIEMSWQTKHRQRLCYGSATTRPADCLGAIQSRALPRPGPRQQRHLHCLRGECPRHEMGRTRLACVPKKTAMM